MNESIFLGRIAGVRVGMNWSLFAIFGLIAWSLADGRFPYEFPGYTDGYYWAGGLLTATIFFACLLGHEMGHALVARARGVDVEGITLWLFGGVAKLKGDPKTASEEFQIAIAGPVVSLVLAGAFAGASVGLDATGSSDLLVGICAWLWRINAILAVFNMLPAFPLDGGRVFRALLWHWKGKTKATKWAARTGQAFGLLMISAGILEFAVRQSIDGIWIAFLGYFLLSAATAEERVIVTRDALVGVTVAEAMSAAPEVVSGWTMVDGFLEAHGTQSRSHFAVASFDGSINGVISVKAAAALPTQVRAATRTDRIAIPISQIAICHPTETLTAALERMSEAGSGRALVFDDGALVGEITGADLQRIIEQPKAGAEPT
ncbi:MAG: CBS domain-containing protein [Actinobacteria bacterium]|nr:CBS domain-containing protein [Actinomycetota bacterium]